MPLKKGIFLKITMKKILLENINFELRKINISDVDDIFKIYSNAELLKFSDSNLLKSKEEAIA